MLLLLTLLAPVCLAADPESPASPASPRPLLVGYLPDYRIDRYDPDRAAACTDVIYFSARPQPDGRVTLPAGHEEHLAKLAAFARRTGVRVHLCVGGWERSQGFAAIAADEQARRAFAQTLLSLCRKHGLAGVDLDWEHPATRAEETGYAAIVRELAERFRPHGLVVTAAVAPWQTLPPEFVAAVDRLHVMAYDLPGRHSTFEGATAGVEKLLASGIPAQKLVLGVPFYGRRIEPPRDALTYAELLEAYRPAPDADEVGGFYFNGPSMLRRKAEWARRRGLGGIMVWELAQDAPGDAALLPIFRESLR